ncbi:MAG: DUF1284 domain-containing protein [Firmicutes bacterium]|nr:DUF1284 domain-containing protein [Bacillota bacterium]
MNDNDTIAIIKLRPHHLLCLQGFSGKGYSTKFIENMAFIKQALSEQEAMIDLKFSSDDICAKCPHLISKDLCQIADTVKTKDNKVIKYFDLTQKLYNFNDLITQIKQKITPSILADICSDCAWYDNSHCRKNILGKVSNQDTREIIFKLVFERIVNGEDNNDTFFNLTEVLDETNLARAKLIYEETSLNKKGKFINSLIENYANEFKVERIYKIDLAIMFVAIYEILFDELSHKIAANEAVVLSKKYSTEKSSKYINGILSSIIKDKEKIINECKNT